MPTLSIRYTHTLSCLLFGAAVFSLAGCEKKGPKDSVSGKVTLNGQPVAGQVIFVGADKSQYPSPIGPDGNYEVLNVPKGDAQILVKGMAGGPVTTPGVKGGPKLPDTPGTGAAPGGVAPPKKYELPGNGLKLTVTGGQQTHNIELTP